MTPYSKVRRLAIEGSARLGMFRVLRRLRHRSVAVLSYHGFVDDEQRASGRYAYLYRNTLSVRHFAQHVDVLRRSCHIFSPDEFLDHLEGRRVHRAHRLGVLITIDDACRSANDLALPVLVASGVRAILFAPTVGVTRASAGLPWYQWHERLAALLLSDATRPSRSWSALREFLPDLPADPGSYSDPLLAQVERLAWLLPGITRTAVLDRLQSIAQQEPDQDALRYGDGDGTVLDLMTWDQLRAARHLGMEVGSHTESHAKLGELSEAELRAELAGSAREIRAQLEAPCRFFSMPYDQTADCHPRQEQVLRETGYRAAFLQEQRLAAVPGPLHISRIGIPSQCSAARLEFYLSGMRDVLRRTVATCRSLVRLPDRGLAKGTAWMLGAQGIRLLAQLVYFVLLARRLGAAGYGAFAAVLGTVSLAVPFAAMGAGSFLIRGVSRGLETPRYWWGRALLTVMRGGATLALVVVAIGWLVLQGRIPFWLLLGVTISDVMLLPLIEVSGQAFQALERLDRTALTWVLWSVLKVGAAVTLTIVPGGSLQLWAILYPLSTGGAALVAVAAVTRRVGWPPRPASFGRGELREGLMFSLSGSARSVYDDIDKTMLARLATLRVTGIYGAAYRVIDVAFLPVRSLVFAAYPRFFARGAAGVRASADLARRLVPPAAAYGVAAGVALYAFAPLVPLALGPSYAGVDAAIRWLCVLPLLRALHYFAADALTGSGHQEFRTVAQISVAALNIALNFLLIPAFSWHGAAWASIASDGALAVTLWLVLTVLAHRPAVAGPSPSASPPSSYELLGVKVHALTSETLTEAVAEGVRSGEARIIANHNLHSIYLHRRDEKFRAFYGQAHLVHIDGMSVVLAGRLLGLPIRREHRVTYADWIEPLLAAASDHGWRVMFLGSDLETVERGAAALRRRHPGLILETLPGFFDAARDGSENDRVLRCIRAFGPQLLMVGMGMPRQEHWIVDNLQRLPGCVVLTAGGAMTYPAGTVPTPPRWSGAVGLEWLFRLLAEPRRLWKRYLLEPWPILGALVRELVAGPPRQVQSEGSR